jgi:hypothetical protein
MKRSFDYDPVSGLTTTFEATPEGFVLHYSHDAESVLENNKALAGCPDLTTIKTPGEVDMWHVAEIPIGIQYKWLIEHGIDVYNRDHWPKVRQLLNSNEWRYLRTKEVII